MSQSSFGPRQVRLFQFGSQQAVPIPADFALPGTEVTLSRDGDRLIIEPLRTRSLAALLANWDPLDEELCVTADPPAPPEDVF